MVKKLNAETRRVLPSVVGQRNGTRMEHLATLWFMAAIFTYLDQRSLPFLLVFARILESRAYVRAAYSRVDLNVHVQIKRIGQYKYTFLSICVGLYVHQSRGLTPGSP